MKLIIKDHEVLSEEIIKTNRQEAVVQKGYCMLHRVTPSETEKTINTTETTTLSFGWHKFDTGEEKYQIDKKKEDTFRVEITKPDGEIYYSVELSVNEELEFSAEESGEYIVRTVNPKVDNAEIKVVVENG